MREVSTVKDLRDFLNEWEKKWTKKDEAMLGHFDNQPVLVWYDREEGMGYGPAYITHDITGLGFVIDQPEDS